MKFGTDGVRGVANEGLTPESALALGQAVGRWLGVQGLPRKVAMGEDTRRSSPMLSAAVAAGLASAGADVALLGVVPTGAVGWAVRQGGFGAGVMVSASHNPAEDNGVKVFGDDGAKATPEAERFLEEHVAKAMDGRPTGAGVGRVAAEPEWAERYADWLTTLVPERLDGMRLALDAANGAAYRVAPEVLRRLGAELVVAGASPDGMNINAGCGATHPDTVQAMASQPGIVAGVAFDGDADRAVFSDHSGRLVNGDRTMAVWVRHWAGSERFQPAVTVGTVMTNGGFEAAMGRLGVEVVRVAVGDKHVSAKLGELGAKIGGEQSGHIVFPEHGPTGDGLVTALELLRVVRRTGRPLAELADEYVAWPQLLVNVRVDEAQARADAPAVRARIAEAEARLDGAGRVNVRASGTQPMVRVMVEATDAVVRDEEAEGIVGAILAGGGAEVVGRVDLTHALGD
jgi:phosphoglucosamine mutase